MIYICSHYPKVTYRAKSSDSACSIPGSIGTVATRCKPTAHRLPHPTAGPGTGGNAPAGSTTIPPHQRPLRASSRLPAALQRAGADEHPGHDARVPAQRVPDGLAGSGRSRG